MPVHRYEEHLCIELAPGELPKALRGLFAFRHLFGREKRGRIETK